MRQSKYIVAAPDELYHAFKYVRKWQGPDGKWRYYYGTEADHGKIRDAGYVGRGYKNLGKGVFATHFNSQRAGSSQMTDSELAKRGRRAQATMDQYEVHNVARRAYTNTKRKVKARIADLKARLQSRFGRGSSPAQSRRRSSR